MSSYSYYSNSDKNPPIVELSDKVNSLGHKLYAIDEKYGEILQRLKILEAAYAVQNKKLRELTRPPQSDKLTKS